MGRRLRHSGRRRRDEGGALTQAFRRLLSEIGACRACVDAPAGKPLPHEPRPVVRVSRTAKIAVCGQAPGARVHASGIPFDDPSGARLRDWMGVSPAQFYDQATVAFIPMGFCFPGNDAKGGDLPPRRECAPLWRDQVLAGLLEVEVMLLVGLHAQRWHLVREFERPWREGLTETVRDWRAIAERTSAPVLLPLPHPSWRNTGWLKANPWFERDLVPYLRQQVARLVLPPPA
jgi:uracil-DNA glycosylase